MGLFSKNKPWPEKDQGEHDRHDRQHAQVFYKDRRESV